MIVCCVTVDEVCTSHRTFLEHHRNCGVEIIANESHQEVITILGSGRVLRTAGQNVGNTEMCLVGGKGKHDGHWRKGSNVQDVLWGRIAVGVVRTIDEARDGGVIWRMVIPEPRLSTEGRCEG